MSHFANNAPTRTISGDKPHGNYLFNRITPTPIVPRSRSGSFKRAFSACAFVLNGLGNGVNSPWMYVNSSHRSMIFIRNL
jgi:hypothetical protein